MRKLILSNIILAVLWNLFLSETVFSWDDGVTHKDLSEYAAENSVLSKNKGDYLKSLGFNAGLDEVFIWDGKNWSGTKWLRAGAELEDAGSKIDAITGKARFNNHFHNPLKLWTEAGLNDWVGLHYTGESSLLWAQDGNNQQNIIEGDWSWQKTRSYLYLALISQMDSRRQENFARTFRGLGHQMHLLQDTAVPDHVRNDAHPEDALFGKDFRFGNYYFETWTKKNIYNLSIMKSFAPNPVFPNVPFNISHNGLAPITQLFDTDTYDGLNASAGINQGLSEYTNANFFSNDTIFAAEIYSINDRHYFPYPKKTSTDLQSYINQNKLPETVIGEDNVPDTSFWVKKERDGETIDHFLRPSYLSSAVLYETGESSMYSRTFYRDDKCHEDYTKALLPRAVGYSAGLLNYFFRGNIDISLPGNGVYSLIDASKTGFTSIKLLAKNITSTGDEMTDGSIELVVKYKTALDDPFQSNPVPTTNFFFYKVFPEASNRRSIPKDSPIELTFNLGQDEIPILATDLYLQLVYHGKLGNEDGAVAVGFKDISEPTPVDIFNNKDKICINGSWYNTGSPEALEIASFWDVYSHDMKDIYTKISSITNPQNASSTNYDSYEQFLAAGSYKKLMYVLSDYQNNTTDYRFSYSILKETIVDPNDSWTHIDLSGVYNGNAIKNQTDYNVQSQAECGTVGATAPCEIRYYPLFYSFRGVNMWGPAGVIFDNTKYPEDTSCSWGAL